MHQVVDDVSRGEVGCVFAVVDGVIFVVAASG